MKVIKPGREQKEWAKEFKCTGNGNGGGGCGAVLLVEKSDLFYTQEFEREGGGTMHTGFQCSQCNVLTDIPDRIYDVPHYNDWKRKQK